MSTLNLFPARVPIGLVQPDGTVLMTPEFVRAMRALFERVGGPDGMASDDLAILAATVAQANSAQAQAVEDIAAVTSPDWSGQVMALLAEVLELRDQVTQFSQLHAELAEMRKELASQLMAPGEQPLRAELSEVRKVLEGVELQATFRDPFRVNWERPGTIGSLTPSSGAFTTISATGQITSTLATGTAPFSIASTTVVPNLNVSQLLGGTWATPGTIGSTTPNTGAFTTLTASQAVTLSPVNANVTLSPTGTGLVTINPATAGAMDNVTIGATTAKPGTFTQLSIGGLTTGIADFRIVNGATLVVGRTNNVGVGSQPGAYAVRAPNASGTEMVWGQVRVAVSNATASSEACSLIFSTRVAGSFVDCVTIDGNGNIVNQKGVADQSYSYQTPATGFSITIGASVKTLLLDPAGTLATGTITMPAAPVDGQIICIASSQTITALTVNANSGQSIKNAPTALTVSTTGPQGYAYIYRSSNTTWYRLQ